MEKKSAKHLTFGRRLSGMRLEKGMDLSEISNRTKVNRMILQLIENGDHAKLPDYVFTKGFVQAYADTVGLERREILLLYQESYDHYQNLRKAEADLAVYGRKFWPHLSMAMGILFFVMACSFVLMIGVGKWKTGNASEGSSRPEASSPIGEAPQAERQIAFPVNDGSAPRDTDRPPITKPDQERLAQSSSEPLHLKITAIEETWVKIIVDDERPRELILKPGDRQELKSGKRYNLLIGSATGVSIELNGKSVAISGRSGQVATVMLP